MTIRVASTMTGFLLALILAPAFCSAQVAGQNQAKSARKDEKGTFLGLLFGPRMDKSATTSYSSSTTGKTTPDTKTPAGASGRGVVVTHVLPDSPAAKAKLRRGDILLEYDRKSIRDGDHLAQLIRDDKPDHKVQLVFKRGASTQTVETTLVLGPALKLSSERPTSGAGGTPDKDSVSVWAMPLESGKMKVTIEYYSTGKLQTLSCDTVADLASTVQKLPERERNLVRIALQRLRSLNTLPTRTESAPTKR
jgi:membrane-associated protease RseP (regulator of RpoE activity)